MAEDLTKRGSAGYLQEAATSSYSLSRQTSPKPKTVRVSASTSEQRESIAVRDRETRLSLVSFAPGSLVVVARASSRLPAIGRSRTNVSGLEPARFNIEGRTKRQTTSRPMHYPRFRRERRK